MSFIEKTNVELGDEFRQKITTAYRLDETTVVENLLQIAQWHDPKQQAAVEARATKMVENMRHQEAAKGGIDRLLNEYDLSSEEGIALMCLAESLLRIPDAKTMDKFIKDKLARGDWKSHLDRENPLFVNAATWGLMLTGKIYRGPENSATKWGKVLNKLVKTSGEGVIRSSLKQAMQIMGRQFVMGETIEEALDRAAEKEHQNYTFSYDMLGEAAKTYQDAERYFAAYKDAIAALARVNSKNVHQGPGISVKLSALHPRYELAKRDLVFDELLPKLLQLVEQAKAANVGFTVDAEESERLDLSLDLIEAVLSSNALDLPQGRWQGFGLAVQAYQKRAVPVLDWLSVVSKKYQTRMMVRLVKGAYWDAEIKKSQEQGLSGFPVFTRKQATDVSYVACAKRMLAEPEVFYPQFATHNAYTVAAVMEIAGDNGDFEFQRLHGMGQSLYDDLVTKEGMRCRVYAPVGGHKHLLAYLVRRLLENGANTSFVNRINDADAPISDLVACPIAKLRSKQHKPHPHILLPIDLFDGSRKNSRGIDISNRQRLHDLQQALPQALSDTNLLMPLPGSINQDKKAQMTEIVRNPSDHQHALGEVVLASTDVVERAIAKVSGSQPAWDGVGVAARSKIIEHVGDLLEDRQEEFLALLITEAGKTLNNAIAEVREAIDFCRYYAHQANSQWAKPEVLPGPTGESNTLQVHGRGMMVCISPWNFPLAIFMGQVVAALVSGNTVIAKPAEQTPVVALKAVQLMYEAGVPEEVLACLPGDGETVGAKLVNAPETAGVLFTGSYHTAKIIERSLAKREGPIVPLIAETGGQNCLIVDSTALLEQVVTDAVMSAFDSAGQRCSALRVMMVHESIADELLDMLVGAMKALQVGDPRMLATDIGPVIDDEAKNMLQQHIARMQREAKILYQCTLENSNAQGTFVPPTLVELDSLEQLQDEVFGPVLHVLRYKSVNLNEHIDTINNLGFGLTFGLQSRIEDHIDAVEQRVQAGNLYINRNTVGAVVGVQPFGGQGLSGTGPKAGGPHYLARLVTERTLSINTTAFGGNASLLSLDDDAD